MKIAGIILLVLGVLCLVALLISLFAGSASRGDNVPFIGNTWAPILASFLIPAGAALLIAHRKKRRTSNINQG